MIKPKFSILLPTKNRIKLLTYAINSVIEQDFEDYELIISDNNSSDGTKLYCEDLNDERIKYYRLNVDVPVTDNWNNAYSKAQGRYIFIIGDDDFLTKSFLHEINFELETNKNSDVVIAGHARYHFDDYFDKNYRNKLVLRDYTNVSYEKKTSVYLNDFSNFNKTFHSAAICIKKSLLDSIVAIGDEGPYREPFPDYTAIFAALSLVDSVIYIDKPLLIAGVSSQGCGIKAQTDRKRYWTTELSKNFEFLPPIAGDLFVNYYYISQRIVQSQNPENKVIPNLEKYLRLFISELFLIRFVNRKDKLEYELKNIKIYARSQSATLKYKIYFWLLIGYLKLQLKKIGFSRVRLLINRFNDKNLIVSQSIKEASTKV